MNLFARFETLKTKVGGNREKRGFEFTMGTPIEERASITPPSPAIRRILSEVNFALQLSKRNEGCFDAECEAALTILEACMAEEGTLTKSACMKAEEALLPLQDAAKAYDVIYIGHAHLDMNWMWGWQETVAATLSTFRTMLNLMKEYPDFTYAQSQTSCYKLVEDYDPDMMQEIKARIAEGRWEVTANAWVETDKNMPDTESLIRHIGETRAYLKKVWGVENVKVDFSPDTFGHSRFVPEINTFGSVPYYYHCRGLQDNLTLYRYIAPSGAEVLMYKEPYWYNSGVCPDNGTGVFEMEKRCNGLKTALIVYGVGDHGGGPTRRDIETVLEMQKWPIFPTLRFGTLQEFFQKAETVREGLPIINHELNAIFTGCYTTQSRIKLANRRGEAALLDSERMSALANVELGTAFPAEHYTEAWQNLLFTHFHDILTGSCVQESREYAMGKLATAIAYAQTEQAKAMTRLSEAVDTSMFKTDDCICRTQSEGAGVGFGISNYAGVPNPERGAGKTRIYTVFNASAVARKAFTEITVWDYTGKWDRVEVVDSEGKPVDFQLLDREPVHYWDHRYMRMLIATDVPALGYAVYAVREKEATDYPTFLLEAEREELPNDRIVLENEKIKATFDTGSGQMQSMIDKASGEELLGAPAGLTLIHSEDSDMSAWRIGRYMKLEPVVDTYKVTVNKGAVRQSVTFFQKVMNSDAEVTVYLDKGADTVAYEFKIDWRETCKAQPYIPLLTYRLPLKQHTDTILTDVPAGFANRPSREMDVPALTYGCANNVALISDCKYGFRLADDVLSLTLINTAGTPDLYPERGIHAIKLFVALTCGCPACLKRKAETLIRPMTGIPTASHPGKLPAKASLVGFDAAHTVMSAMNIAEDGALTLRMYEMNGEADRVTVRAPFKPAKAVLTNLAGCVLAEAAIDGDSVAFDIGAHKLAQLKLYK